MSGGRCTIVCFDAGQQRRRGWLLTPFLVWHVADMKFSGLFSVLVIAAWVGAGASVPAQTQTERPKKTYRNPIIDRIGPADPHVIRHDGKYYLYPTLDGKGYDVFVSDDTLHVRLAPLLLREDQEFVAGATLKADLRQRHEELEGLDEGAQKRRHFAFGMYARSNE